MNWHGKTGKTGKPTRTASIPLAYHGGTTRTFDKLEQPRAKDAPGPTQDDATNAP